MKNLYGMLFALLISIFPTMVYGEVTETDIKTATYGTRATLNGWLMIFNGEECESERRAEVQIFYNETEYGLGAGAIVIFKDKPAESLYVYFTPRPLKTVKENIPAEDGVACSPLYMFLNDSNEYLSMYLAEENNLTLPVVSIFTEEQNYVFGIDKCSFTRYLSPGDEGYDKFHEYDEVNDYDPYHHSIESNLFNKFIKSMYGFYKESETPNTHLDFGALWDLLF